MSNAASTTSHTGQLGMISYYTTVTVPPNVIYVTAPYELKWDLSPSPIWEILHRDPRLTVEAGL